MHAIASLYAFISAVYLSQQHSSCSKPRGARTMYNARFIQKDTHVVGARIARGVLDTTRTTFHELLVVFSLR
jgi:hypothetical protein